MHIALDAVGIKHSGGATVLLDFLQVVINDSRFERVSILCTPRAKRWFTFPETPKLCIYEQFLAEESYLYRMNWFQFILGRRCSQVGADVLLCMSGAGRARLDSRHVTFIQQSLPFAAEFIQMASPTERTRMLILKRLMLSSCRSAKRVIVQTPTMKSLVTEQFMLPAERVSIVIPPAPPLPGPESSKARVLGEEGELKLLYVGNDCTFKNVRVAVMGLDLLRRTVPNAVLCLTWPTDHAVTKKTAIVCLGHLSRSLLANAYREATLLVMPSLVETVGLPMIEAMNVGLPVLAADRPYAHDIAENAAFFFDPLSPRDFAEKAGCLLLDAGLRQGLIEKGRLLIARREASNPYQKMLDLTLDPEVGPLDWVRQEPG